MKKHLIAIYPFLRLPSKKFKRPVDSHSKDSKTLLDGKKIGKTDLTFKYGSYF